MAGLLDDYMQQQGGGLLGGFSGGGYGPMLMAAGAGLLGGQGFGGAINNAMATQRAASDDALKRMMLQYQLGKDARDFNFRTTEASRAQSNADRTFGLQERNFGLTDDIKEFNLAKTQGFTGTLEQWMQRKRAGAGEYALTPQWGRDKDGNPVMLQLGKGGDAITSRLPEGVTLQGKEPIKMDAGTHFVLMDPITRQTIGIVPKDIAGKEAAEEVGKARGIAQATLPGVINTAEQTQALLDEMIKHPGRETATGMSRWADPRNYLAGTDATNFAIRADQMQGRTFLQAYESLRGAGAITEQEGKAATSAIARLNRSQSDEEYLSALNELKGIVERGVKVARQKAGLPATGPTAPAGGGWSVQEVK